MYKIAILGCENSHAADFLRVIRDEDIRDVEVVGVYSCFAGAAEKLHQEFGVPVMAHYADLVGQLDGLIITARHGANHYPYAQPYLDSGIPMFLDKPIVIDPAQARAFCAQLKQHGIPVSGGSTLKHAAYVQQLKALLAGGTQGEALGGYFRAPIDLESEHGGFFFYAQHLVQTVCELFGYFPKSVRACRNGGQISCTFRYAHCDVTGVYLEKSYVYYAAVNFEKSIEAGTIDLEGAASREFNDFYRLLQGQPQAQSYEGFFAPVFIMNAITQALDTGCEVPVQGL